MCARLIIFLNFFLFPCVLLAGDELRNNVHKFLNQYLSKYSEEIRKEEKLFLNNSEISPYDLGEIRFHKLKVTGSIFDKAIFFENKKGDIVWCNPALRYKGGVNLFVNENGYQSTVVFGNHAGAGEVFSTWTCLSKDEDGDVSIITTPFRIGGNVGLGIRVLDFNFSDKKLHLISKKTGKHAPIPISLSFEKIREEFFLIGVNPEWVIET